ncbi:MAG: hypothetical protein AAF798_16650 [Bacteroidota bacterium]
MQMDVGAQIVRLLFDQDKVAIPGLGVLEAQYKEAGIDHIEGTLSPPSKSISFNQQQTINDGLLTKQVQQAYQVGVKDAEDAVQAFVTGVKNKLDQRDIVEIDQLGRLYVDYEGTIKLLPDKINFNTEVYGLPTLKFEPISRVNIPYAVDEPPASGAEQDVVTENISNWFQRLLPVIGVLTLAIIALGVYLIFFYEPTESQPTAANPSDRVNISPAEVTPEASTTPAEAPSATEDQEDASTDVQEDTVDDTEGATVNPDQAYAIVAVGLFGKQRNVERMIERIYKAGYEPYTQKEGKNTRVGVVITFEDEADFQEQLRQIRKTFDKNSKVLKKVE